MTPEIGHYSLCVAFLIALLGAVALYLRPLSSVKTIECLSDGFSFLVAISFACLWVGFVSDDFSIAYVASHSNTGLPWFYKVCAVWGSHEGSMLLWLLIFAGWGSYLRAKTLNTDLKRTALGLMLLMGAGMTLFILATSNPFHRYLPNPPIEGGDLNPLLQDAAFAIHPPILYMGYVGMCIPFVLAMACLIHRKEPLEVINPLKKSTLVAWSFLTFGITLGSWWAYYELGWGGWWFWDPVENASLMPWLASCALLHAIIAYERVGSSKNMMVFLALLGFSLSLLGTFLVRSGVITSVHAFASDPSRGVYILIYLGVVITFASALFALRSNIELKPIQLISKESGLLAQVLLMLLICATTLLGTLYPLIIDALTGDKLSVGPPFFNAIVGPMFILVIVFMTITPHLKYKRDSIRLSKSMIGVALLLALFSIFLTSIMGWLSSFVLMLCLASFLYSARKVLSRGFFKLRPYMLAHLGVLVATIGVVMTTAFDVEKDLALVNGEIAQVGDYQFKVIHIVEGRGSNWEGVQAKIDVYKHNRYLKTMYPEKRYYPAREMALSETAISAGLFMDLYVAMGEPLDEGWSYRIYLKPFVRWLWLGGLLMSIAGFWSAWQIGRARRVNTVQGKVVHG